MTALSQSALSTEYIQIPVEAVVNGRLYNPTGDVVEFAFKPSGTNPGSGDWHTGSWDIPSVGKYVAQTLIGPGAGGVPLATGTYDIWLRITDSPEQPVRPVGFLSIT